MRILFLVLALSSTLVAQKIQSGALKAEDLKSDEPPALTEVQRLQVEKAILVYQNTQLRLQLAQDDHTRSQLQLQDVLKGLPQKDGWAFDVNKFVYVKKPKTEEKK